MVSWHHLASAIRLTLVLSVGGVDAFARELCVLCQVSRGGVLPGSAFLSCIQLTITLVPEGHAVEWPTWNSSSGVL